jgi:hypothetical protein
VKEKQIIGRYELADFPELGISSVKVKTDTGAYTSSIHCSSIIKQDDYHVRCVFLDPSYPQYTGKEFEYEILKEVMVKSSNGYAERRFKIRTTIHVLGKEYQIDLTLTHRNDMKYGALIGRKFLHRKFLVDVDLNCQS